MYATFILPRLIDCFMAGKTKMADRAKYVGLASGTVLEVGVGSGHNLPFYGSDVVTVFAVDPSRELWKMAERRSARLRCPVEFFATSAERIPISDESIDTVVVTWTLCTIPDVGRAVHEMKRVLKPGGRLIFIEHGAAPDPRVRRWQDRLNPVWRRIAGGCRLNRKIDELLERGGFRLIDVERAYAGGPKVFDYTYKGVAVPDNRRRDR